ncbi:MAG: glycosyltransferase [Alphaproteobacteria bacterium]|nr:glycosyltransferase [Alphaproteobacteria bacterium]
MVGESHKGYKEKKHGITHDMTHDMAQGMTQDMTQGRAANITNGMAEGQASFLHIVPQEQETQLVPALPAIQDTNQHAQWQLAQAIHALARHRPAISAHQPIYASILGGLFVTLAGIIICIIQYPTVLGFVISVLCFLFAAITALGLFLWVKKPLTTQFDRVQRDGAQLDRAQPALPQPATPLAPIAQFNYLLDEADLPDYAILLPLYREAKIVPQLMRNMAALIYPHNKLDILFIIEEKDKATHEAIVTELAKSDLPARLCIVPDGVPRTKPRACTYALSQIDSDLCVIYDAEDCPHPMQLREAAAHFTAYAHTPQGRQYACFQAPLAIVKTGRELLARQMQLEYAHLFGFLLPALARLEYPVPLGGTSNHLRTDILRHIHGWDAWNVTEDADLGIRLYEEGYLTGMLSCPTQETATRGFYNHLCQRTRWQKGHLQTWLVRLRHPIKLWRALGARGFMVFQLIFLGRTISGLAHIYMICHIISHIEHFPPSFDTPSAQFALVIMVLSYLLIIMSHVVACVLQKQWHLLKHILLLPVLWLLTACASLRAIKQILYQPAKWEKTEHEESAKANTRASKPCDKRTKGQAHKHAGKNGKEK